MKPILLLLVEENYLLPVVISPDGRFSDYQDNGENRFWLYFCSSDNRVDSAYKYKSQAESGVHGYYGDVLRGIAAKSTAEIFGQTLPVFSLIRMSQIQKRLTDFYRNETADKSSLIPTFYFFAESLEYDARKAFMAGMREIGFDPKGFSVAPTDMIVRWSLGARPAEYSFGDYIALITSSGNALRLTTAVFDGESWMADGGCKVIDGIGDAPLKAALVRSVVDEVDRTKGYLVNAEKIKAEYLYQMKNADSWYEQFKKNPGDFEVADFRYSFDESVSYSCFLSRALLDSIFEDTVRKAMNMMEAYIKNAIGRNSLKLTILNGPAFDDEKFATMVSATLGNPPRLCIQSHRLPEIFKSFPLDWEQLTENISEFDRIADRIEKNKPAVAAWISSASKVRALWTGLEAEVPRFRAAVEGDGFKVQEMLKMSDSCLAKSDFNAAREKLSVYPVPGEETRLAKADMDSLMNSNDELQIIFQTISSVEGARSVLKRIEYLGSEAASLLDTIREFGKMLKAKETEIRFYEAHYDEYLELKRKYRSAQGLKQRRELVQQMDAITAEPLPALKLDTVEVVLSGHIETEKSGFLGLKKNRKLVWSMQVKNGERLPCRAFIDISCESQIQVNEGDRTCIAVEIPEGTDSYSGEIPLPDGHLSPTETIKIYIFAAHEVLDIGAIKSNYAIVKQ